MFNIKCVYFRHASSFLYYLLFKKFMNYVAQKKGKYRHKNTVSKRGRDPAKKLPWLRHARHSTSNTDTREEVCQLLPVGGWSSPPLPCRSWNITECDIKLYHIISYTKEFLKCLDDIFINKKLKENILQNCCLVVKRSETMDKFVNNFQVFDTLYQRMNFMTSVILL